MDFITLCVKSDVLISFYFGRSDLFQHNWFAVTSSCFLSNQLPDATPEQIKKAYYNCMKSCHPDLSGNDPDTTNFCIFINEVYEVGYSTIKF